MPTQLSNLSYDCSTTANYKAIMQAFGTALTTAGWANNADTGSVSWGGISTLPTVGTYRDWEVWKMADAAQTNCPVYIKLEYTVQNTNCPQVRLTIGQGSNGSGVISGIMSAFNAVNLFYNTTSTGAATPWKCYYAGGTSWFTMLLWRDSSTSTLPWGLSIERSHDASGADTDEYVTVVAFNMTSNALSDIVQQTIMKPSIGGQTTSENKAAVVITNTTSGGFNSGVLACPVFPLVGKLGNPCLGVVAVKAGDVAEGTAPTVLIYGASHTYTATKQGGTSTRGFQQVDHLNATGVLMRYE